MSNSTIIRWLNPSKADQYRKNRRERYANDPEYAQAQRQKLSKWKRERYATDPEYRAKEKRRSTQGNLERYASNPKARLRQLLYGSRDRAKKHGYEPCNASVDQLLEADTGHCRCCGVAESELPNRLVIDHCHDTGDFRGFLCQHCNRGIGFLRDAPYAAFNYLDPDRSQLLFSLFIDSYRPNL